MSHDSWKAAMDYCKSRGVSPDSPTYRDFVAGYEAAKMETKIDRRDVAHILMFFVDNYDVPEADVEMIADEIMELTIPDKSDNQEKK